MQKPEKTDEDYEIRKQNYRPMPELKNLIDVCNGDIGLIFCKDNAKEVKDAIKDFRYIHRINIGSIAPDDLVLPGGSTGFRPSQTNLFFKLNIPIKITKGLIEILNDTKMISKGEEITKSQLVLLNMMKIVPFIYKLSILHVYDNGMIYSPDLLDLDKKIMLQKVLKGAACLSAASVEMGYPIELAVKPMIRIGFRNLIAISFITDYNFKQAQTIKDRMEAEVDVESSEEEEGDEIRMKPKQVDLYEVELLSFGNIFGDDDD